MRAGAGYSAAAVAGREGISLKPALIDLCGELHLISHVLSAVC